jgi:conjugal transfer/entry exclusion protein
MNKKRVGEESSHTHESTIEKKIVENLIELQKVNINLAEKFNKLSEQISQLLNIFEMAARNFASNPANQVSEKDKQFLEKIDKLLEQNKTIAKGLTLMDEKIRERVYGSTPKEAHSPQGEEEFKPSPGSRPLPKF